MLNTKLHNSQSLLIT